MFLTLYLQLLGMSDGAASALMALFLGGRHACIILCLASRIEKVNIMSLLVSHAC